MGLLAPVAPARDRRLAVPNRPKLAPDTIHRERLTAWLRDHDDFTVRLLLAPSGSGKTTALILYARQSRYPCTFLCVTPETTPDDIVRAIAAAFSLEGVWDFDGLLQALATLGRCEILVDEADRANAQCHEVLTRFPIEAPANVTFVYVSRTRDRFDTTRLVSLGLGALMNAERLAFTHDEATCFVERSRALVDNEHDVTRLLNDTEGWAFAFCSAVRDATSSRLSLTGAFERWRSRNEHFIRSFVDAAVADEPVDLAEHCRDALAGAPCGEPTLARLEARGLFVRWSDGAFRPYRAVARTHAAPVVPDAEVLPPFDVRFFGAYDVSLNGRAVEWIRRRDAQLFAFLALQPDGRASRNAIIEAFWPDTHPQLASQSLRTGCSTMRRALAKVVGYGALSQYMAFGDDLALNLDAFRIDARRARAHLADSRDAAVHGEHEASVEHAEAALRLARAPFLNDDVHPALRTAASELAEGLLDASRLCANAGLARGA